MKSPVYIFIILLLVTMIVMIVDIFAMYKNDLITTRDRVFKIVDKLIFIFSFAIILITTLWDFNFLEFKSAIEYNNIDTITLNDFRGLNKPFNTLDGESEFAFINTSINISKNNNKIFVKSYFNPCSSYVYNRNLYSQDLLKHELYHFRITEYFARLIRQKISNSINNKEDYNLRKIKNQFLLKEALFQEKYDDESYHGFVNNKQLLWQNKIDSLLIFTNKYSETFISLD